MALPAPILTKTITGMATKKAKRDRVRASSGPTKPTRRQIIPRKIRAKKGMVRDRTADIRNPYLTEMPGECGTGLDYREWVTASSTQMGYQAATAASLSMAMRPESQASSTRAPASQSPASAIRPLALIRGASASAAVITRA